MKRVVVAVLASFAVQASAQPDPKPYVYLSAGTEPITAGGASQMVAVSNVNQKSPRQAAIAARETAYSQVQSGRSDPDHICILLHNFGVFALNGAGQTVESSLFHNDDRLNPLPVLQNPQFEVQTYQQPWLTSGKAQAKLWMEKFVEYYNDPALPAPPAMTPARFHFDLEQPLIGIDGINQMRVMEAVSLQQRWVTEQVCGFPPQTTMKLLYEQAIQDYGWPDVPLFTLGTSANRFQAPDTDANRKYFTWYRSICQRARDAALNEAAYEVIKAAWPNCLVSNYDDISADEREDDFGWYYNWNNNQGPIITTRSVRGLTPLEGEGRRNIWGDLLYPPVGNEPASRSLWYVAGGQASGDFSAPALYTHSPIYAAIPDTGNPNCGMDAYAINPYLSPELTPEGAKNRLSIYDASLAIQRRTVEGILNTPGNGPGDLAPWILGIGANPGQNTCHPVERGHFINQLAMLRAKRVGEVMVWWDIDDPQSWEQINLALDGVFMPKLYWLAWELADPQTGTELTRVWYTLRKDDQGNIDETMVFRSVQHGNSDVIEIYGSFIDTLAAGPLSLNLECAVTDPTVRGRVYMLESGGTWHEVPINDFASAPEQFGFFAPQDPQGAWCRTRRTIPVNFRFEALPPNPQQGTPGQMIIKVVLSRPTVPNAYFDASFDLMQIVGWGASGSDEEPGDAQGADFDYSGDVNQTDLNTFYSLWLAQSPAADFNMDGVVDTADLAAFLQAYAQ